MNVRRALSCFSSVVHRLFPTPNGCHRNDKRFEVSFSVRTLAAANQDACYAACSAVWVSIDPFCWSWANSEHYASVSDSLHSREIVFPVQWHSNFLTVRAWLGPRSITITISRIFSFHHFILMLKANHLLCCTLAISLLRHCWLQETTWFCSKCFRFPCMEHCEH